MYSADCTKSPRDNFRFESVTSARALKVGGPSPKQGGVDPWPVPKHQIAATTDPAHEERLWHGNGRSASLSCRVKAAHTTDLADLGARPSSHGFQINGTLGNLPLVTMPVAGVFNSPLSSRMYSRVSLPKFLAVLLLGSAAWFSRIVSRLAQDIRPAGKAFRAFALVGPALHDTFHAPFRGFPRGYWRSVRAHRRVSPQCFPAAKCWHRRSQLPCASRRRWMA